MVEYDCKQCGVKVCQFIPPAPKGGLCLQCGSINRMPTDILKAQLSRIFGKPFPPTGKVEDLR